MAFINKRYLTDFANYNYLVQNSITEMQTGFLRDRFILDRTHWVDLSDCGRQQEVGDITEKYDRFLYKEMIQSSSKYSLNDTISSLLVDKDKNEDSMMDYERVFNPQAQKILDAPEIKNDFYLNLLDWSSKGTLAIGLAERVYLYSQQKISELCVQESENYICSLSYHPQGSLLSVGLYNGQTHIYDTETQTLLRKLRGHQHRVSSASFTYGLLYTGSRDTNILGHDIRAHHNVAMKLQGHRGQVCGLKNNAVGLASGSNDNLAIVWDINMSKPRHYLNGHKGAVKAITWCPWQHNLLATGGGATDKTIKFWNTQNGKVINTVNTDSQVCSLVSHPTKPQIISSHGYLNNQLNIWRVGKQKSYLNCSKIGQLKGHSKRVLHMAIAPDNSSVCTASADQTLRFWNVFEDSKSSFKQKYTHSKTSLQSCNLR